MLLRLEKIGQDYQAFKAKVTAYSTDPNEYLRGSSDTFGGQWTPAVLTAMAEEEDKDAGDTDEVQRSQRCFSCFTLGQFARDCRLKGKGEGKGKDGGTKDKGKVAARRRQCR